MIIKALQKNKLFRKIIYACGRSRAEDIIKQIGQYLNKTDNILDIGCGICNICEVLKEKNYNVTPLDVKNLSFVDKIEPIIYDGKKIPFKNDKFDVALILTVLHHTFNHTEIIKEAKRVAKRIIIIEDIYTSKVHKYLTYFIDSLLNFEFRGHPHSNKTDKEWQELFKKLGLSLKGVKYNKSFLVFKHAVYYLESRAFIASVA